MSALYDLSKFLRLLPVSPLRKPILILKILRVSRSEDPRYWQLAPKDADQALSMFGLPADWAYDRSQLDQVSFRLATDAWRRSPAGPEVWAITHAKIMLLAKNGDGIDPDEYETMCSD